MREHPKKIIEPKSQDFILLIDQLMKDKK